MPGGARSGSFQFSFTPCKALEKVSAVTPLAEAMGQMSDFSQDWNCFSTAAAEPVPEDQRVAEDEVPEPTAEPTDASDPNWITPDLFRAFEEADCTVPQSPEEREAQDADAPTIDDHDGLRYRSPGVKWI